MGRNRLWEYIGKLREHWMASMAVTGEVDVREESGDVLG